MRIYGAEYMANLEVLAEKINKEHEACKQAFRTRLEQVIRLGEALAEAKAGTLYIPGGWLEWLMSECPSISPRQALDYMRIAQDREKLESVTAEPRSTYSLLKDLVEGRPDSGQKYSTTPVTSDLTNDELKRLRELEAEAHKLLDDFYTVGLILLEIRDARLYRTTSETFEKYITETFDFAGNDPRLLINTTLFADYWSSFF